MKTAVFILGIVEIFIGAVTFLFKKKASVITCLCLYNVLLVVQYLLQGFYTEIIIVAIMTLRNIIFFFYEKKGLKPQLIVLLGFETAMLLSGILTFNGWSCIFMIMSSMLGTYCLWQNNMTVLRVANVVCSLLLITNYICTGLYTTIIAQTIILTSIIVSIVRLDILPRRNNTMV